MTWKRWLKRTLGAVVLVLALRTVWLVGEREWHRSQGEKEYAAAVAETDRTDPDWRWDALNAKRIKPPAGKNAADLIPRINALTPKDWGNRLDLTDEGMSREHPPANTRFDPDLIGSAREELARAHPAVELARTLKVFPAGYRVIRLAPNPYGTLLEDTQATRGVSNLLRWDIVIAVEDGDTVRAATDLLAMLYASRSIGDEPFLISQLVRIATRSIAHGSLEWVLAQAALTEPQLAGLQSAWAVDAEEPLLLYGLRGKRVVIDETIGRMAIGTVSFMQGTTGAGRPSPEDSNSFDRFAWWLYRGRLPRERAFALRWLNDAIEVARRPVHEQPAAMATLPFFKQYADRDLLRPHLEDFAPPEPDENLIIFRLLIPGLAKIPRASWRSTAEARSTVVALACERFRLKHGRWPKELAELPAELLPGGVPLDPFDGKLLCYRRLDDGVVIYSIGPDGTDNEGTIARDRPGVPGTDIGFRMWNPEQRRKPAVQPGDGVAIPPPREVKP